MLHAVARIPSVLRPLLLTLTYPGEWNSDPRSWKRDLDAFGKAFRAESKGASMVWKLEPQERGAPHYHGLLYGCERVEIEWLRETWFRIVGSEDPRHLKAGTRIERARLSHAAVAYAAKCYAAKMIALPPGWEKVGRWWGIIGRRDLPQSAIREVRLDEPQTVTWRRLLRRWGRGKGIAVPEDGTFGLLSGSMACWGRALDRLLQGDFTNTMRNTEKRSDLTG